MIGFGIVVMLGGLVSVAFSYAAFDARETRTRYARWSAAAAVFGAVVLAAGVALYNLVPA